MKKEIKVNEPLPEGFVLYTEWPEYVTPPPVINSKWIQGATPNAPRGFQRSIGPLSVETYVTDTEPVVKREKGDSFFRLVIWQPLTPVNVPTGWKKGSFLSSLLDGQRTYYQGLCRIDDSTNYTKTWGEGEQRALRKFNREIESRDYQIEDVSFEEFWDNFKSSITYTKITQYSSSVLFEIAQHNNQTFKSIRYRCIKDSRDTIYAGLASLNSNTHRSSLYFIPFLSQSGLGKPVMIGLIDDLFKYSIDKKFTSIQFGRFWKKGAHENMKGFSAFKMNLNPQLFDFPAALVSTL